MIETFQATNTVGTKTVSLLQSRNGRSQQGKRDFPNSVKPQVDATSNAVKRIALEPWKLVCSVLLPSFNMLLPKLPKRFTCACYSQYSMTIGTTVVQSFNSIHSPLTCPSSDECRTSLLDRLSRKCRSRQGKLRSSGDGTTHCQLMLWILTHLINLLRNLAVLLH